MRCFCQGMEYEKLKRKLVNKMSLWNYAIFDLIVSTGNLRRAAEIMNLTSSAVSHSLIKLEKEFGFPLLIRDRTGIELTEHGREILPHIRAVLAMDKKLHAEVERISGKMRGSIRIGVFNSICCTWLPSIIRQIRREYPEIKVSIVQGSYDDMEKGLSEGTLDLAFVSMPTKRNISAIPLLRDRLLCATPRDFFPRNKEYITIDEIREQEVIIPGTGSDFDAIAFMKENDLELEIPHNIIEDSSIIALVESGLGITIIPELVLQGVKGNVNIFPIENAPYRMIGLATQKSEFATAMSDTILKLILNYVQVEYAKDMPYFRREKQTER